MTPSSPPPHQRAASHSPDTWFYCFLIFFFVIILSGSVLFVGFFFFFRAFAARRARSGCRGTPVGRAKRGSRGCPGMRRQPPRSRGRRAGGWVPRTVLPPPPTHTPRNCPFPKSFALSSVFRGHDIAGCVGKSHLRFESSLRRVSACCSARRGVG